ncbi:hypothetical protein D3C74_420900 [compost metagenome]
MLGMRQVDHEFLSAIASQNIGTAHRLPKRLCRAHQYFVSNYMTIVVINGFEVVDIEQHEGKRHFILKVREYFMIQMLRQVTAVKTLRQTVRQHQLFQLAVGIG